MCKPKIASSDITSFLEEKGRELQKAAPGFSSLAVTIDLWPEGSIKARFCAYNEHLTSSPKFDDVDDAIAWIRTKANGKTESQMIIAEATKLLKKAEELAANGK